MLLGSCQGTCLPPHSIPAAAPRWCSRPVLHAGAVSACVHLCGSCCPQDLLSETLTTATLFSHEIRLFCSLRPVVRAAATPVL